jgi:hypothetical protein
MRIAGIDPGPYESAYCFLNSGQPTKFGKVANEELLGMIRRELFADCIVPIETIFPRGQSVGLETMNTQFWAGRFAEALDRLGTPWHKIDRQDVRFAICGSLDTNDSSVRKAIIDHYGGERSALKGKKCSLCKGRGVRRGDLCGCLSGYEIPPGPLRGVTKDMWSALAIAIAWQLRLQHRQTA